MADFSPYDDAVAETSCNFFFYYYNTCTRTVIVSFVHFGRTNA